MECKGISLCLEANIKTLLRFRWVSCQLDALQHCFPSSVKRTLEELPETLDGTYERVLREIVKPNQGHAHRLLQCLVAAVRPLQVNELAEVLAIDFDADGIPKLNPDWQLKDQEQAVMSACSSLVTIVKDGDSRVVQFSHSSVKEFLMAKRLTGSHRDISHYHIQLTAAHTILAQACLGVLLQLDDSIDRDKIKDFPLAPYAAEHWVTHARIEDVSLRIKDGMECVFDADKPHFATWLWIYDPEYYRELPMHTMRPEKPYAVPLHYAARLGFRDLAEHLIASHPEHVNARTQEGNQSTPMHLAAEFGHADVLSLLLENGADLEAADDFIMTPLHRASFLGTLEAVRCLLDHGANIEARCNRGRTPLFRAARRSKIQVVRLLLERGADVNARDDDGKTPSQHGVEEGVEQEVLELLSIQSL